MQPRREGAISAERLHAVEKGYAWLRRRLGEERSDKIARALTGATMQLDWSPGVVITKAEAQWACYEGNMAIRGLHRRVARFWPDGFVFSTNNDELTEAHQLLQRKYGEDAKLAVAYRADGQVHVGTLRTGQCFYVTEPKDGPSIARVFARRGPGKGEMAFGIAIDLPQQRAFMPIDTDLSEKPISAVAVAAGSVISVI